jgi:hypothetical protein
VAPSPWPRFAWLREAVCFLAGAGLVAVGVYGTLAICFPVETNGVFQYQAGSGPRLPEGVVWHFGRWGYAPPALHRSLRALALNMPDLVLALWGGIRVWPRRDRTGRLLVLWATTVLLFTLTQIYQPPRYFLVALPAVVWLSAMGMEDLHERLAARSTARRATLLVSGLVAAFALFHLVRLGYSAALTIPRNDYPQRTAWLRQVLPADAHVAAAPYLALELPGPVYDFFRICWPYGCSGPVRSLRQATETFDLTYFVVDGMEWQTYLWPEDEEFLRTDCEVVGRFRDLTVYRREGKRKEGEGREKRGQKG